VPPGTVSYASGDPQGGVGKVLTANKGTYTITAAGYTTTACALEAFPTGEERLLLLKLAPFLLLVVVQCLIGQQSRLMGYPDITGSWDTWL
jgi:hypothetical protein